MAGATDFDDAFLQSSAKNTDLIQTIDLIHEVNAFVQKLESELVLVRLSIAASSAALHTVNDKVNELRQRVEDMEARLSKRFDDSSPNVDTF